MGSSKLWVVAIQVRVSLTILDLSSVTSSTHKGGRKVRLKTAMHFITTPPFFCASRIPLYRPTAASKLPDQPQRVTSPSIFGAANFRRRSTQPNTTSQHKSESEAKIARANLLFITTVRSTYHAYYPPLYLIKCSTRDTLPGALYWAIFAVQTQN
jgi:hypothetical protein